MRVLLDENVPKRLLRYLPRGVEATTVPLHGWAGRKNGDLLGVAEQEFDVFLTMDRGIPYEQDLSRFDLTVLILHAKSNAFDDLEPLVGRVSEFLSRDPPGGTVIVEA